MKYWLIIFIVNVSVDIYAQEIITNEKNVYVEDVLSFEKILNSKMYNDDPNINISISPSLCPPAAKYLLEQPIRFYRVVEEDVNIESEYHFTANDYKVRCATYTMLLKSIDRAYDDKGNISPEFDAAFEKIVSILSKDFGEPSQFDKGQKEYLFYGATFLKREAEWVKDSMFLKLRLDPSSKRLRISQYWSD